MRAVAYLMLIALEPERALCENILLLTGGRSLSCLRQGAPGR